MDNKRYQIELMRRLKKLEELTKRNVPEIYACFAKVLYEEYNMDGDQIEELFNRTQEVWNENAERMDTMVQWCEETTGICLRGGDYTGEE